MCGKYDFMLSSVCSSSSMLLLLKVSGRSYFQSLLPSWFGTRLSAHGSGAGVSRPEILFRFQSHRVFFLSSATYTRYLALTMAPEGAKWLWYTKSFVVTDPYATSILGDSDSRDLTSEEDFQLWAGRGLRGKFYESSYLAGGPPMGIVSLAEVDYERCFPTELKRFVVDRGLSDPLREGTTLRWYYLRLLTRADKAWTFRFMDLPAEMRVLIYRQLLLFDSLGDPRLGTASKVFPAILSTCKEIYSEAKSVLYDGNDFPTGIDLTDLSELGTARHSWASLDKRDVQFERSGLSQRYLGLPYAVDRYQLFLRSVRRFTIVLKVECCKPEWLKQYILEVAQYLIGLASFLMEGHRLKYLKLSVDIGHDVSNRQWQQMLYPLRRVRNVEAVELPVQLPAAVANKLLSDHRDFEPVFNTIRYWSALLAKAKANLAFQISMCSQSIDLDINEYGCGDLACACGALPAPMYAEEVSGLISTAEDWSYAQGWLSHRHEENFLSILSRLRRALNRLDVTQLTQDLAKLRAKTLALRQ